MHNDLDIDLDITLNIYIIHTLC